MHHVPAEASAPAPTLLAPSAPPYLVKVQDTEEVRGVLLGNLGSFLFSHTAVTRQAVTQKYLGISQLMEFALLQRKDDV